MVNALLSVILSTAFLLQTFVTVPTMLSHDANTGATCMVKKEVDKTHTCCTLLNEKETSSEKKNCCSGTSKMSCCVHIVALTPNAFEVNFIFYKQKSQQYGHEGKCSFFKNKIDHPPILG